MIAVLFGTRPEFIKLAPFLSELKLEKIPFILIHSGQHYSDELDKNIAKDLKLPKPDYTLEVGSSSHGEQTARILIEVEKILKKEAQRVAESDRLLYAGPWPCDFFHVMRSFSICWYHRLPIWLTPRRSCDRQSCAACWAVPLTGHWRVAASRRISTTW